MLHSKHEMIKIREIKFEKTTFSAVCVQSDLSGKPSEQCESLKYSHEIIIWTKKKVLKMLTGQATPANVQGVSNQIYKRSETHSNMVNGWKRLKNSLTHLLLSQILQQSALSFYSWGWSQQTVYYWPQRCTLQCVFLVEFHCCCTAKRCRSIRGKIYKSKETVKSS